MINLAFSDHHPTLQFLFTVCLACGDEQEYRLTRYLMANYDASVRPSHNASQPLKVVIGLALHQLVQIDESNQLVVTNCWLSQAWTDFHLRWNATDFGGIKVIRLPVAHVWKPDILLYNNADASNSAIVSTNVIINSTGEVTWLSHAIFKSTCNIDVNFFPFDVQHCQMRFASWTYDGNQVDLSQQSDYGDISRYQSNGDFELEELSCERHVTTLPCCPDQPYYDVTYILKLRRRPLYHVFNLILPCTLINAIGRLSNDCPPVETVAGGQYITNQLIVVTASRYLFNVKLNWNDSPALLVFYLPCDCGERVSVAMGSLIALSVFILMVRQTLPPTNKMPLISYYYGASVCVVCAVTCLSVLSLSVHYRGSRGVELTPCLRKVVLGYMAKILLLRIGPDSTQTQSKTKDFPPAPHVDISGSQSVDTDHLERYNYSPCFARRKYYPSTQQPLQQQSPQPTSDVMRSDDFERQFLRVLNKIYETIDKSDIRCAEQDRKETIKSEWQQVALVCDRFLFTVLALVMAVATFALLFSQ
ncbi:hypothetical protein CHUAL_010405 [Chamberlinius hualienensis]